MTGLLPGPICSPRVFLVIGFVLLGGLMGSAGGCTSDAPQALPQAPAPRALHLTFGGGVSPLSVAPGDTFSVRYGVSNGAGRDTWVTTSCEVLATAVIFRDGVQAPFEGSMTDCEPAVRTFDLPSGGSVEWVGSFVARIRISDPGTGLGDDLEDAPPGDYSVRITPRLSGVDGRPMTFPPMETPLRVRR
jgi:hypothetical protein